IVGETDARADDLLVTRSGDERTDTDLAVEWLTDELADGGWHESREIKTRAKAEGIAERTLQRAKKTIGVEDRREGFPAVSEWRLPVAPTPSVTPGATEVGATGKTPVNTEDSAPQGSQSRQVSELGATLADVDDDEWLTTFPGSSFDVERDVKGVEAAKLLGIHPATLDAMCRRGEIIPRIDAGPGKRWYPMSELRRIKPDVGAPTTVEVLTQRGRDLAGHYREIWPWLDRRAES
ncbi:MAG: helix-turn-helix domain-containing protein, partial [Solirubrobacteraceae bacterium]